MNFPHAGVQHAIVGSATFLRYWGELGQVHPNRVFVHFGDSDVVSLTNPRGGNSQSVFDHFTEVISRSHPSGGGFSALVRLGGAVAYSTDEIDTYLVEAGYLPPQAFGGEPSPLAKFNALLAQANQLIAAELATGDYPVGYFLEPNTLINADYLGPLRTSDGNTTDGLLPAMSQLSATRARGFANTYAVHRRLRELRLHKRPHSRFLGRREAQVQTSTRGARRTYVWKHLHEVADEVRVTDELTGEVARWVPKFPGRTLFVLGAKQLATNFTFNPTRLLATLGSLTGLGSREKVKELFDPDRRAAVLARLDPTRRRETARKLVAMYKVNSRVETLMSDGLTGTVDELFDYLRRYGEQPDPDWYVNELDRFGDTAARTPHVDLDLSDLDASDSDVDLPDVDLPAVEAGSGARRQTRSVSPGPEPAAALDDVLADLLRGLRLADDPRPPTPGPPRTATLWTSTMCTVPLVTTLWTSTRWTSARTAMVVRTSLTVWWLRAWPSRTRTRCSPHRWRRGWRRCWPGIAHRHRPRRRRTRWGGALRPVCWVALCPRRPRSARLCAPGWCRTPSMVWVMGCSPRSPSPTRT